MSLKDVFCQDRAIGLLERAYVAGRVPHAYIFAGPDGVGRFKTACEWAALLLCSKPVAEKKEAGQVLDSCGSCESCRLLACGTHPDFHHLYKELREFTRDGKGKGPPVDMPIDVIREFLIDKAAARPTISTRKVFVVSEAERLNASSQNCLLKVLEEPPESCCIILLCTRLDNLLPTTRSRCQIIRFGPVAEDVIVRKLAEAGLQQKQATYFARLALGSLGLACQWARLEKADAALYQTKRKLIQSFVGCELADALELAREFLEQSQRIAAVWSGLDKATSRIDIKRRAQRTIVRIVISALHDAMISQMAQAKAPTNFDQIERIAELAARMQPETLAHKIEDCYEITEWIDASVNEKLIFEHLLLNMAGSDTIQV